MMRHLPLVFALLVSSAHSVENAFPYDGSIIYTDDNRITIAFQGELSDVVVFVNGKQMFPLEIHYNSIVLFIPEGSYTIDAIVNGQVMKQRSITIMEVSDLDRNVTINHNQVR